MTNVYLTLKRTGVFESADIESKSGNHKLWFQGGGFNVWVDGTLKHSGLNHAQVSHAALVAVQACGGKVSALRDVRKSAPRRKAKENPKQLKLL